MYVLQYGRDRSVGRPRTTSRRATRSRSCVACGGSVAAPPHLFVNAHRPHIPGASSTPLPREPQPDDHAGDQHRHDLRARQRAGRGRGGRRQLQDPRFDVTPCSSPSRRRGPRRFSSTRRAIGWRRPICGTSSRRSWRPTAPTRASSATIRLRRLPQLLRDLGGRAARGGVAALMLQAVPTLTPAQCATPCRTPRSTWPRRASTTTPGSASSRPTPRWPRSTR